jgi:hypothetical protein
LRSHTEHGNEKYTCVGSEFGSLLVFYRRERRERILCYLRFLLFKSGFHSSSPWLNLMRMGARGARSTLRSKTDRLWACSLAKSRSGQPPWPPLKYCTHEYVCTQTARHPKKGPLAASRSIMAHTTRPNTTAPAAGPRRPPAFGGPHACVNWKNSFPWTNNPLAASQSLPTRAAWPAAVTASPPPLFLLHPCANWKNSFPWTNRRI